MTNSLFIVPQLTYMARDGDAGRFRERGFFRELLAELLSGPLARRLGGPRQLEEIDRIVLVAHSAGFETALAAMRMGEASPWITDVILMDALYAAPALFAQWTAEESSPVSRRIVSLHTGAGRTKRFSEQMGRSLESLLGRSSVSIDPRGSLVDAISRHRAVIARTRAPHGQVPARHLTEVLTALDLHRRARVENHD